MVDLAMPAVNFYSQLSGLGDTIAANRAAQAKKDAFAAATTPGPDGNIDYGKAILGLAQVDPQVAGVLAANRNHEDTIKQQAIDTARNAANDTFNHTYQNATLALQKRSADRLDDPTPAGFQRTDAGLVPLTGGPADPAYIAAKAKAEADVSGGKPIPYETLSGTKFLVKQPNGGYAQVDPQTVGQPQPAAPLPVAGPGPVVAGPTGTPVAPPQTPIAPPGANGPPAGIPIASPSGPVAVPAGGPPVTPVATAPAAVPTAPVTPQGDLTAVDPQTGRREAWLASQPPDVQAYIKKVADYEIDPRTSSIKGGHREQIMSAVAQYDPTYNQNEFGTRAKAMKDFGTGPQGNSVRSFDVAIDHLDLLKHYTKALDSGDVRMINSLRNKWLEETGSPLPTNLQAVAPIVGAEVSKAVIGSNNALADREELRGPLRSANSVPQINGAIEAYQGLMAGQLRGLKKQYEDTTGKKNFDSRVRETTRNVLLGGNKAQGNSDGDASQPNVTSSGIKWSVQ